MKTTAKAEVLQKALEQVNHKYQGNVRFERFDPHTRTVEFTLGVNSSKEPGHRRGFTGKRVAKACWHVHGDFFEAVLRLDPTARIVSRGGPGSVITKQGGNWQDCNIGSMMNPLMYSQACDCNA